MQVEKLSRGSVLPGYSQDYMQMNNLYIYLQRSRLEIIRKRQETWEVRLIRIYIRDVDEKDIGK